ncbi:hypothetical protein [Embleya hyalina]|uniref:ESX-1 secretion-associated protein n=1 Tax=Embleya hyalina TaxID=516124 RepID=A0A401YYN7_9ACTN|nr:hypothetical protein [Embleya hyalina]GCD99739.1 hypothetical protein EHYA_07461 [Embleya hyalina]
MSSELVPVTAAVVAPTGDGAHHDDVVRQLEDAAAGMRLLSEAITTTFAGIDDAASSVYQLAETAAALNVDTSTLADHRDAAAVMRAAHGQADHLASKAQDMAVLFARTADEHSADYGPVDEAVKAMPVPMADRSFYANR